MINQDVKVHVLGVGGNQIRIGVEAPKEVTVHRDEV
ncbi:MAG: carbon storage regulator [Gammaproteobacteria bacterium]|nr:carbon storage regulator [Gammaproteobacteria bacterium]